MSTTNTNTNTDTESVKIISAFKNAFMDIMKIVLLPLVLPQFILRDNNSYMVTITFVIALMHFFTSYFDYDYYYYYYFTNEQYCNINNCGYLTKFLKNSQYMSKIDKNNDFETKLCYYLVKFYSYKIKNFSIANVDGEDVITPKNFTLNAISTNFLQSGNYFPLYYKNKNIIGLYKSDINVNIVYTSESIYDEFSKKIHGIKFKKEQTNIDTSTNFIIKHTPNWQTDNQYKYPINSDRNINGLVSVHMESIRNHMDMFIKNNQKNQLSCYNGHGTYNLGIMLHGLHGCGKTSLIKAIANYLNRTIVIVEMQNIKTCEDFRKLFYVNGGGAKCYDKYVYVLEEIDCVDSVLVRNDENREKSNEINKVNENTIVELQKIIYDLSTKITKDNEKQITDRINDINSQINVIKQKLNLMTLLVELDGVIEMRGRVLIATTNFIDKIDPALMREGRFDLKIKLEEFNKQEICDLLVKMFESSDNKYIKSINHFKENIDNFPDKKWTPAQITNICHKYPYDHVKITDHIINHQKYNIKNE